MSGCLEVSGRSVGRHWEMSVESVLRAADAGFLRRCGQGFDAQQALELGRRPYVEDQELDVFPPGALLLVQQSPTRLHEPNPDRTGRWVGYNTALDPADALRSASGWWPVPKDDRLRVRGLVSTVSSFVVTLGVVDTENPVLAEHDERPWLVMLNVTPASKESAVGRTMLRVFDGKRVRVRPGSSFLLPGGRSTG